MKETFSMYSELEWFINPISSFFNYFLTTTSGIIITVIVFVIYLLTNVMNDTWVRRLQYGRLRVPAIENLYVFVSSIVRSISNAIVKLSLLIGLILFFALIISLNESIGRVNSYISDIEGNKEVRNVIRQINREYKIAEIKVEQQKINEVSKSISSVLKIKYYNIDDAGATPDVQNITIDGSDFYIEADDLNVEYSELSADGCKSLTIPVKIYSDEIGSDSGIKLKIFDNEGIPYYYKRKKETVFGIPYDKYLKNVKELISYRKEVGAANARSIRVLKLDNVHQKLRENTAVQLWVNKDGGISLRNFVIY